MSSGATAYSAYEPSAQPKTSSPGLKRVTRGADGLDGPGDIGPADACFGLRSP